jgi:hypothetical protein
MYEEILYFTKVTLRQGCKGFSSFVRSFSEQKTEAKRSLTQPARAPKKRMSFKELIIK